MDAAHNPAVGSSPAGDGGVTGGPSQSNNEPVRAGAPITLVQRGRARLTGSFDAAAAGRLRGEGISVDWSGLGVDGGVGAGAQAHPGGAEASRDTPPATGLPRPASSGTPQHGGVGGRVSATPSAGTPSLPGAPAMMRVPSASGPGFDRRALGSATKPPLPAAPPPPPSVSAGGGRGGVSGGPPRRPSAPSVGGIAEITIEAPTRDGALGGGTSPSSNSNALAQQLIAALNRALAAPGVIGVDGGGGGGGGGGGTAGSGGEVSLSLVGTVDEGGGDSGSAPDVGGGGRPYALSTDSSAALAQSIAHLIGQAAHGSARAEGSRGRGYTLESHGGAAPSSPSRSRFNSLVVGTAEAAATTHHADGTTVLQFSLPLHGNFGLESAGEGGGAGGRGGTDDRRWRVRQPSGRSDSVSAHSLSHGNDGSEPMDEDEQLALALHESERQAQVEELLLSTAARNAAEDDRNRGDGERGRVDRGHTFDESAGMESVRVDRAHSLASLGSDMWHRDRGASVSLHASKPTGTTSHQLQPHLISAPAVQPSFPLPPWGGRNRGGGYSWRLEDGEQWSQSEAVPEVVVPPSALALLTASDRAALERKGCRLVAAGAKRRRNVGWVYEPESDSEEREWHAAAPPPPSAVPVAPPPPPPATPVVDEDAAWHPALPDAEWLRSVHRTDADLWLPPADADTYGMEVQGMAVLESHLTMQAPPPAKRPRTWVPYLEADDSGRVRVLASSREAAQALRLRRSAFTPLPCPLPRLGGFRADADTGTTLTFASLTLRHPGAAGALLDSFLWPDVDAADGAALRLSTTAPIATTPFYLDVLQRYAVGAKGVAAAVTVPPARMPTVPYSAVTECRARRSSRDDGARLSTLLARAAVIGRWAAKRHAGLARLKRDMIAQWRRGAPLPAWLTAGLNAECRRLYTDDPPSGALADAGDWIPAPLEHVMAAVDAPRRRDVHPPAAGTWDDLASHPRGQAHAPDALTYAQSMGFCLAPDGASYLPIHVAASTGAAPLSALHAPADQFAGSTIKPHAAAGGRQPGFGVAHTASTPAPARTRPHVASSAKSAHPVSSGGAGIGGGPTPARITNSTPPPHALSHPLPPPSSSTASSSAAAAVSSGDSLVDAIPDHTALPDTCPSPAIIRDKLRSWWSSQFALPVTPAGMSGRTVTVPQAVEMVMLKLDPSSVQQADRYCAIAARSPGAVEDAAATALLGLLRTHAKGDHPTTASSLRAVLSAAARLAPAATPALAAGGAPLPVPVKSARARTAAAHPTPASVAVPMPASAAPLPTPSTAVSMADQALAAALPSAANKTRTAIAAAAAGDAVARRTRNSARERAKAPTPATSAPTSFSGHSGRSQASAGHVASRTTLNPVPLPTTSAHFAPGAGFSAPPPQQPALPLVAPRSRIKTVAPKARPQLLPSGDADGTAVPSHAAGGAAAGSNGGGYVTLAMDGDDPMGGSDGAPPEPDSLMPNAHHAGHDLHPLSLLPLGAEDSGRGARRGDRRRFARSGTYSVDFMAGGSGDFDTDHAMADAFRASGVDAAPPGSGSAQQQPASASNFFIPTTQFQSFLSPPSGQRSRTRSVGGGSHTRSRAGSLALAAAEDADRDGIGLAVQAPVVASAPAAWGGGGGGMSIPTGGSGAGLPAALRSRLRSSSRDETLAAEAIAGLAGVVTAAGASPSATSTHKLLPAGATHPAGGDTAWR